MNHGPLLILGVFVAVSCSWYGMLFAPQKQIGSAQPERANAAEPYYPSSPAGDATLGREVYRANGCAYCHSLMVRDADVPRWGPRQTVARDYLFAQPVLLGSQRIGPDLSNIGLRRPDAAWHLRHLYNPQITMPEGQRSQMPPYAWLFEKREAGLEPSPEALNVPGAYAPGDGYEIVPTAKAIHLVAFLQSLQAEKALFEAPVPQSEAEAEAEAGAADEAPDTDGSTNAPPEGMTNNPAQPQP